MPMYARNCVCIHQYPNSADTCMCMQSACELVRACTTFLLLHSYRDKMARQNTAAGANRDYPRLLLVQITSAFCEDPLLRLHETTESQCLLHRFCLKRFFLRTAASVCHNGRCSNGIADKADEYSTELKTFYIAL